MRFFRSRGGAAYAVFAVFVLLCLTFVVQSPLPVRPAYQTTHAGVIIDVFDPSLQRFATGWHNEINRRFPNAVGLMLHGGEIVNGEWFVKPDGRFLVRTADLVRQEQAKFPGKTIVVIACNPGHLTLGIPGVYYAKDSVWCIPDRAIKPDDTEGKLTFTTLSPVPFPWVTSDDDEVTPTKIVYRNRPPTRWEEDPTVAGNIFEFQSE